MSKTDYKETRQHMSRIADEAEKLFHAAKHDCHDIFDPITWLRNQDNMRTSWEQYRAKIQEEPLLACLSLNGADSFAKYMNFMYTNYPPGFGKAMMEAYKSNGVHNAAKLYDDLMSETLPRTNTPTEAQRRIALDSFDVAPRHKNKR